MNIQPFIIKFLKSIFLFICKYKTAFFLIGLIIVTYYASVTIFNIVL